MIRRHKKKRKLNADINVVPYIDVMMVLLVIFMITAPMLTQGVNVELPKASAEPVDDKDSEPVIVTVNAEGEYFIDVGGDPKEAVSAETVQERISKIIASNPKKMLLVRGDRNVNYDKVVQLMVLLQQAGAPSVGLVTE
ncbi:MULTISPECIES: protein TolR [unclassified Neptuniibacter]|uniref:protein TolR n=1 Tax=unclassified Neptuniibacter TaxID=2630693 RepID=UPI000C680FA3|nr:MULTISPECIES: protein TolR [unclassified Neptuniibacter]MAY42103.1 protein TolR [Oceanospirillaceae bacterium]|tara:strand:+ start:5502 stop:5918 length:417 start_codon:yes stop_codon:yes gene_type:complete